jgi:MOSC domain-containing protein YiiM
LRETFVAVMAPAPSWTGEVVSIHIADKAEASMRSVDRVRAIPGKGLEGDRYFSARGTYSDRPGPGREVTFIESEAIEAMARDNDITLPPGASRRNVMTRGAPLNHLVGQEFEVGRVRLVGIKLCEPCSHLESLTKKGIIAGLVHRGGLRAKILTEGEIRVGDSIVPRPTSSRSVEAIAKTKTGDH